MNEHRTWFRNVNVCRNSTQMPLARIALASGGVIPRGDKDAILNSIVETYRSSTISTKDLHRKKHRGKPRKPIRKISRYQFINLKVGIPVLSGSQEHNHRS